MPDGRHDEHRMVAPMGEPSGDAAEVGMAWIRPASADDDDHDVGHPVGHLDQAVGGISAQGDVPLGRYARRGQSAGPALDVGALGFLAIGVGASVTSTSQGSGPPKVRIQVATAGSAASVAGLPSTPDQESGAVDRLAELNVRTDEEHRLRQPAEEALRDAAQQPLAERARARVAMRTSVSGRPAANAASAATTSLSWSTVTDQWSAAARRARFELDTIGYLRHVWRRDAHELERDAGGSRQRSGEG